MRKDLRLTRRAVGAFVTIAVVAIAGQGAFERTAIADDPIVVDCASLPNPTYAAGSSAIKNVLAGLATKLAAEATPTTIVYKSTGSCDGVNTIIAGLKVTGTASYWKDGTETTCNLDVAGQAVNLGMADVFPTSCPDVTADLLDGFGDFAGPVQSMNIVVPKSAKQTTISAEAAYLTFGLGATGKTDWDNKDLYAIRNFQSGTETMIAGAINVPTNKWLGTDSGSGGGVIKAVGSPTGDVDKTIGILSSSDADANRTTIKRLAFQPYNEVCALYPDSSYASTDKANVRNGLYQIWGPLHMLAAVDGSGAASDAKAAALLDILLEKTKIADVDVADIEIKAHTVPQCAMKVQRTSELGTPKAYNPAGQCGCYMESIVGDPDAAGCKACTSAAQCTSAAPACNRGFCEVK